MQNLNSQNKRLDHMYVNQQSPSCLLKVFPIQCWLIVYTANTRNENKLSGSALKICPKPEILGLATEARDFQPEILIQIQTMGQPAIHSGSVQNQAQHLLEFKHGC